MTNEKAIDILEKLAEDILYQKTVYDIYYDGDDSDIIDALNIGINALKDKRRPVVLNIKEEKTDAQ